MQVLRSCSAGQHNIRVPIRPDMRCCQRRLTSSAALLGAALERKQSRLGHPCNRNSSSALPSKGKHPPRTPLWLCLMQSTMATLVCEWQGAIKLLLRPADSSPSNPSGSPTCLLPGSGHLGALIHHAVSTFLENKRWAKRAISLARIGHEVVGQKQGNDWTYIGLLTCYW